MGERRLRSATVVFDVAIAAVLAVCVVCAVVVGDALGAAGGGLILGLVLPSTTRDLGRWLDGR